MLGPFIAFCVIGVLALALRWTFRPTRRTKTFRPAHGTEAVSTPAAQPAADDFGLLDVVTVVESAAEAWRICHRLTDARIRATVAIGQDGRWRVLVFQSEAPTARRVARSV